MSTIEQRCRPILEGIAHGVRAGVVFTARERRDFGIAVLLFVAAALVPLIFGGYVLQLAISIMMYTALATSWLLFSGPTNYIALSTAAFFGIGMYTVAGGIDLVPYPLLILAAGVAGAALAAIVGLATLRVSGVYFVIFSLGLAELVRQIMTWLQHVLGTMSGLYVTIDRSEPMYFWQLLLMAAVVYLVGWLIGRSRLGFALRIIGNDELVAVHCGINTARAKVILFVISSTFAAVAGAVVAPRWGYVEPVVAFNPFVSFQVVIMALLGGTHRLWGPLLGVIPFVLLWELISIEFPNQTTLLLGVCFLLIVYVIPNGITGLVEDALAGRVDVRGPVNDAVKRAREIMSDSQAGLVEPLRQAFDHGRKLVTVRSGDLGDTVRDAYNRASDILTTRGANLAGSVGDAWDRAFEVLTTRGANLAGTVRDTWGRAFEVLTTRGANLGGTVRDARDRAFEVLTARGANLRARLHNALNRAADVVATAIRNLVQRWNGRNA